MEKFLQAITENKEVREDFLKQKTPEGAYNVAKPYIGNMSMDDFAKQLVGLASAMDKMQSGELDENSLEAVSGGKMSWGSITNFFKSAAEKAPELSKQITAIGKTASTAINDMKNPFSELKNTIKK